MTSINKVKINNKISVGAGEPFLFIGGPCQIENRDHALKTAERLAEITSKTPFNFIYKSSYDKANRTRAGSTRGVGIDEGLKILEEVRTTIGCPVLTDVHSEEQASTAGTVVDVLQIPAFLCRQTDLLQAAAKTGKTVNVKKGQFLAPQDMHYVAEKIAQAGNCNILLCERGTSFGYRDLVVDPRSLVWLSQVGYPVIFDASHSVQSPGGLNGSSGGDRTLIPPLARAAVALGIDGIFIECHENPASAPSDGPSMMELSALPALLQQLAKIREAVV